MITIVAGEEGQSSIGIECMTVMQHFFSIKFLGREDEVEQL